MEKIRNNNRVRINKAFIIIIFLIFFLLIGRLLYLCLYDQKVGNTTLTAFISNRNTIEEEILPQRGTIYDKNGNVLAQNVSSYTVIAYLDEKRSYNSSEIRHVNDIDYVAKTLAPYLEMEEEYLKILLSKDAYQVELGPGGRNLTQLQMEEIKNLNLPGIDFEKTTKRYYPYGDYASYLLGYTVSKDASKPEVLTGELGIEEYYNDELIGKSGHLSYEKDRYGYKIANGREYREEAINGNSIYLTIDSNIQLFTENAMKLLNDKAQAEWSFMIIASAKTGEILGYSSAPSFNPNERDLTSYLDLNINNPYEPGSTMKIFTYMCAIEKGTYNENDTYLSGSKTYTSALNANDSTTIKDWNNTGWGEITYDKGFALSSNIAVANMLDHYITKKELKDCFERYGFGKNTGVTLPREAAGDITFNYDIEAATAAYGQGITITPMQMIQALTAISNDGDMLQPQLVKKIVDAKTGKIKYESDRIVVSNIASTKTIAKIRELLKSVINPDSSAATGYNYYMDGYDLMGKTGTAQIYYTDRGGYSSSNDTNYIYSFAGLYPADNPEIIIYTGQKKPKDKGIYIPEAVKSVIVNVSKYLNIKQEENITAGYKIQDYSNKSLSQVTSKLTENGINIITLGTGDRIIDQYPKKNVTVFAGNKVILKTNNFNNTMVDLTGMSSKEVINTMHLININYNLTGKGYVISQSIAPGTIFNPSDTINIELKENY